MTNQEVINQYFKESAKTTLEQYTEGAINLTFHLTVEEDGVKKDYKLQKMNPMFSVSLVQDIDFITKHLTSKNFPTPEVVRTLKGELFVRDGASWWRVLTYLPGKALNSVESVEQAKEAGRLVGHFHTALLGCNYKFQFKLPHYRGADFYMKDLKRLLKEQNKTPKYEALKEVGEGILSAYDDLVIKETSPKILPYISLKTNHALPERIIHGDLKINNVLFDETGTKAVSLIDIDTFMYGTIPVELGDALRSWCMPGGEDVEKATFSKEIYDAALAGYSSAAEFLTPAESSAIPHGVKLLALELAAQHAIDAFNEIYFTLDTLKYSNLFEQNKKRAENQLNFYKEFSKVF